MIRISLSMIVKNEERILARCLDSVADLVDEIVIVDTGSTDRTKEIAAHYTDRIYDFAWIDDFSAARNFAFSKCTCDYIYSADADEVLDEENRMRFRTLKEALLPEVEIVQMKYGNQLSHGTVYNFDEEYRPKLFKRLRPFTWEAPIHETVRLTPVVYDSDIVITHLPEKYHGGRDLATFAKQIRNGYVLPARLYDMYAREAYLAMQLPEGDESPLTEAVSYFAKAAEDITRTPEEVSKACCVVAAYAAKLGDTETFFKYVTKVIAGDGCSEICCELGDYYSRRLDYTEAAIWYYNAAYETQALLSLSSQTSRPLEGLMRCYELLGMPEESRRFREALAELRRG